MSHEHHHHHEEEHFDHNIEKKPQNKIIWIIWNGMFVLFYPVLAVFSVLMIALMFISSTLSKAIFWMVGLFKKENS